MKQSKSSKQWLQEHFNDQYVKQSKKDGLRSRAAYKLIELQKKYKFIKQGNIVVDLGAAPGGWTQAARQWVGESGRLFALDILPMDPMANVEFIQGDFTEESVLHQLENQLAQLSESSEDKSQAKTKTVDVVLSDMAPNMSGIKSADQAKSMYLSELALDFALQHLPNNKGWFLIKLFQGEGIDQYIKLLRQSFTKVAVLKPDASRQRSREVYAMAFGKKIN